MENEEEKEKEKEKEKKDNVGNEIEFCYGHTTPTMAFGFMTSKHSKPTVTFLFFKKKQKKKKKKIKKKKK